MPENPDVPATQAVAEQEAERIQEETVQSEAEATAKPKTQQTKEQETSDPHILELLKKFPGYPALYVGNGGSTFSPGHGHPHPWKSRAVQKPVFQTI